MEDYQVLKKIIETRHSVRAYLDKPVEQSLIEDMLKTASRAPSGTNIQPWQVYVVKGDKLKQIVAKVCEAHDALREGKKNLEEFAEVYDYYPPKWFEPYLGRRRENGFSLYGLLGIERGEKDKMHQQQQENFKFFDAPVGIFFTLHKDLGEGAKMDLAMFMQNFMLAANANGLATCAQAAWNMFHSLVLPILGAGEDEQLTAALALGYKDEKHIINTFKTPRLEVAEFTKFLK